MYICICRQIYVEQIYVDKLQTKKCKLNDNKLEKFAIHMKICRELTQNNDKVK